MTELQIVISLAAIFVIVALPSIAFAFKFAQRVAKLEQQAAAHSNYQNAIGQAVGMLAAASTDATVRSETMRVLTGGMHPPPTPSNPFSSDEAAHYTRYVQMATNGEEFTQDQVREFNVLIQKYKFDYPSDPNVGGLLILGAFLVGLYLMGRNNE